MTIELHHKFKKAYKKRIVPNPKIVTQVDERIVLFKTNKRHPLLKDHALSGKLCRLRGFWVTGDIRIVYRPITRDIVMFMDIGTHNQVY
jgi:addiction module RelE/StbE family toxin